MILIYSKEIDDFVNNVIDCLKKDYIRIGETDLTSFENFELNKHKLEFNFNSCYFNNQNLNEIQYIWFNGGYVGLEGSYYENSCFATIINSFLNYKLVPKIGRIRSEFEINKIDIPIEAQKQGFKIPETLITGNKKSLMAFYDRFDSGIICKRITDQYKYEDEDYQYDFNLTFSIDSTTLDKIPDYFAISLFQEKIVADFEIRVFYVKGLFYAMSIHTFDDEIDYRTKLLSLQNIRTIPFNLPTSIEKKLEKVFTYFNLNYGSADLMYLNEEFYFLEINPTGQVSFLNNSCNYYIEETIAKILENEL